MARETLAAASMLPGHAMADAVSAIGTGAATDSLYPPALSGLRGNHVGSFEVAHVLARKGRSDRGTPQEPDTGVYDLVVVGGGISGLSAAYFYLQTHPDASVLILDNHDDFGGHAKRNEFEIGGKTTIGYGGSQAFEDPSTYPQVAKDLLRDLGIDLRRLGKAYDQDFYRENGLGAGVFFNRRDWGRDKLVPYDLGGLGYYLPLLPSQLSPAQAVQQMPMSDAARAELLRLLVTDSDQMPDVPADEKEYYLYTTSYRDFLGKRLGITEPEVFAALQDLAIDSGLGIESASAGGAILYSALPGFGATGLPEEEAEPYIYHFPDGNASVARLLVRRMIPGVAPGSTMEDIVTARFDYSKLDLTGQPVRLRLNSTVVNVRHEGDASGSKRVSVSYVQGGNTYQVQTSHCVLACYNAMIPSICPNLPVAQREALAGQAKTPILYTNVALRNWQAWKKLGLGAVVAPGSYHVNAILDFPVSLGGYHYSRSPEDPVVVHMERFPHGTDEGLGKREKFQVGQRELFATPFEDIERKIRSQLADMLGPGGFDPARDIEGITVNRWAHGYAYMYDFINEPYYEDWNDERYPHVKARKPFGRIVIANSDSGASASVDTAIEQAYRAVGELG